MAPVAPRRRLLHLAGSPVDEFFADLSRLYAAGALDALSGDDRYEHVIVHVAPDGTWTFPAGLTAADVAAAEPLSAASAIDRITRSDIDAVLPQMFCRPGMTSYRSLFDVLDIPLVGNPAEVMAIAADKATARAVVAAAGVAVPAGEVVVSGDRPSTPLPVVVKPVDADNSLGVTLVTEPDGLVPALESAWEHGTRALVETFVPLGREVRCGVVVRDGEPVCLPLEEYSVHAEGSPIRTPADKLARTGDGDLYLVAKTADHAWIVPDDDPVVPAVHAAARLAHEALGCRHYSLFDFRIDPDGRPWFLEAGPYCSFSRGSVVAVMAAAAGMDVTTLFATVLDELDRERTTP
ncbi:D-alanine--D-alanine ligase family protein [Williamsia deligens]|uniref:D-alanine--D-alanine ligase n=1 Tax=Williamsia deligens TaxID=321325 RepID=A0ABW3GEQ1_9NOCA|nr:D-alanine--D-alanine ligase [Williamsia deligens]MCP2195943.1 D-alanine-D-alanine ligase [Williamsia deligens]